MESLTFEIGKPVMLTSSGSIVYGRVVGYPEGCRKAITKHGLELSSRVIFSTPHGSEVALGIAHIRDLNENGLEKLAYYESQARKDNVSLYNGKIPFLK